MKYLHAFKNAFKILKMRSSHSEMFYKLLLAALYIPQQSKPEYRRQRSQVTSLPLSDYLLYITSVASSLRLGWDTLISGMQRQSSRLLVNMCSVGRDTQKGHD